MSNLDLDAIKRDLAYDGDSPCEHIRCLYRINEAAPALIAEVERLRQQLATAKKIGAAEELERIAGIPIPTDGAPLIMRELCIKRAAELRAEVGE